ncbi:hypothetical protein J4465_02360 [Candidatus Pacearchaeota archaeon]|nr:hypothetical protein [Candidatus Pacearchaeota archaeon]
MGIKYQSTNQSFPEESEARLEAILNSFNAELKTATFLFLEDSPKSGFSFRDDVSEVVLTDKQLNPQVFTAYCQRSLVPRGMAYETVINRARKFPASAFGYSITEAGKKYGQPIAALTLDYVVKNNISMFSILGSANTNGKTNSPLNRVKILKKANEGTFRDSDLSQEVNWGISSNISKNHLIPLSKIDFIKTESCGELNGPLTTYFWIPGKDPEKVKVIDGYLTKARIIAAKIKEIETSDNFKLAETVNLRPQEIKKILNGLEKQGFIKSKGRWTDERKSENVLLIKGKKFLDEYVSRVENCLADGPVLGELTEFYNYLKNTNDGQLMKDYLNKSTQLYIEASPHLNYRSSLKVQEEIIKCLKANPNGLRYNRLSENVSLRHVTFPLRELISAGIVRKEGKSKEVRYYLN